MKKQLTKSLPPKNNHTAVSADTASILPVHKLLLKQYILSRNLNKAQQQLKRTLITQLWVRHENLHSLLNANTSSEERSNEKA
jgi:hypothetical protein